MSSRYTVQKPYVVATLPHPIDQSNGRYVVAEVYGGAPGLKKRKRSELAVGIDGEGVNLYDITTSKLLTSYALPPQSKFTCPPCALRTRISKSKVERRTYVSTRGAGAQITLFSDSTEGAAPTVSSTTTRLLGQAESPIVYLGTATNARGSDVSTNTSDLVFVSEDGEIQCCDGETLEARWSSPASALLRNSAGSTKGLKVEFATLTNAYAAKQGILKGRPDVFGIFPQEIAEDGFNPELLIIVTKFPENAHRTFHIVSFPRRFALQADGLTHSVESIISVDIPCRISTWKVCFGVQVSAGTFQQLEGGVLTTFDLAETLPKQQSRLKLHGAQSFLRLSSTSVMVSSARSITVYNPKYQSKLATVDLDSASSDDSLKRKRGSEEPDGLASHSCRFASFFPKLGAAIAIMDNDLVAIHVEGQQDRHGRPRASGLLIDSLGRATKDQLRTGREGKNVNATTLDLSDLMTLDSLIPGSIEIDKSWSKDTALLNGLSFAGSFNEAEFDAKIAPFLGAKFMHKPDATTNGATDDPELSEKEDGLRWHTKKRTTRSNVERQWAIYALGRIFALSILEDGEPKLHISFFPENTFMWLINNGYVTVTNIESALRSSGLAQSIPAGQLVDAIAAMGPEMDTLLPLVAKNHLSAAELLHAIRKLMESLGLLADPKVKQKLLTDREELDPTNGDIEEQLRRLEADAEEDLELAEYHLSSGSGIRGETLGLALSKLYACPSGTIVTALRSTFTTPEIISLAYLLRYELARGAWTTRYTDSDEMEFIDGSETSNGAIARISSLLNNCVDAIGAGGWLSGEARLPDEDALEAEDFITSLKLEVGAALEGIEEAVYLKGLMAEMIGYSDAVEKAMAKGDPKSQKIMAPMLVPAAEEKARMLPLGLKAKSQVPTTKVGAGGEVYERTLRDIGQLKSRKVGKYSRERIVV